jgi:hypothetical protein
MRVRIAAPRRRPCGVPALKRGLVLSTQMPVPGAPPQPGAPFHAADSPDVDAERRIAREPVRAARGAGDRLGAQEQRERSGLRSRLGVAERGSRRLERTHVEQGPERAAGVDGQRSDEAERVQAKHQRRPGPVEEASGQPREGLDRIAVGERDSPGRTAGRLQTDRALAVVAERADRWHQRARPAVAEQDAQLTLVLQRDAEVGAVKADRALSGSRRGLRPGERRERDGQVGIHRLGARDGAGDQRERGARECEADPAGGHGLSSRGTAASEKQLRCRSPPRG